MFFFVRGMRGALGRGSTALTCMLQWKCKIGDSGAFRLGEMLKVNSSLRRLILVRPSLFLVFFGIDAGRRPTAVTCVLQGTNYISDSGVKWLGEGMEVNSSLQELDIVRNCFVWLLFVQEMEEGAQCSHICTAAGLCFW